MPSLVNLFTRTVITPVARPRFRRAVYYFLLPPPGQIATSPSFVSLNVRRLFFRESITWPRRSDFLAQLYAIAIPHARRGFQKRFVHKRAYSAGAACARIYFLYTRIVATRLMRLYLHALLKDETHTYTRIRIKKERGSPLLTARCTRYVCIAPRFIELSD